MDPPPGTALRLSGFRDPLPMLLSGSETMIGGMDQEMPEDRTQIPPEGQPPVQPEEPTEEISEATPTLPIWGWEPARAPGTALGAPPPRRGVARVVVASILAAMVLLASGIGIG